MDVGNYGDFGVSLIEGTWGMRPPDPIVWNLAETSEAIKKAGGSAPATIQFDGMEMSIESLKAIFQQLGRPIGKPVDPDKVKEWGARFESLAHRAPPAGTGKTEWKARARKRENQIRDMVELEISSIPGGLRVNPKIKPDRKRSRRVPPKGKRPMDKIAKAATKRKGKR